MSIWYKMLKGEVYDVVYDAGHPELILLIFLFTFVDSLDYY